MSNKATLDKFHEFGSRSIGDMVDIIYVIKPLLFWKNYLLYSINRAYYISNTPWTKVMKLVLNSIILYSKCIDTIKFVPFWNWLEPFLEYLQKIHVKNVLDKTIWPKKLQKLPRQLALISRGSFCNFLGQMILSSIFLRKTDFNRSRLVS